MFLRFSGGFCTPFLWQTLNPSGALTLVSTSPSKIQVEKLSFHELYFHSNFMIEKFLYFSRTVYLEFRFTSSLDSEYHIASRKTLLVFLFPSIPFFSTATWGSVFPLFFRAIGSLQV